MVTPTRQETTDLRILQNDSEDEEDYNNDGGGIYTKKSKSSRKWEWSHLRVS